MHVYYQLPPFTQNAMHAEIRTVYVHFHNMTNVDKTMLSLNRTVSLKQHCVFVALKSLWAVELQND